jgi:predicted ABC-type ATPase
MKPKLIVIAGPNGSGKTSVTGKILEHEWIQGCLYINPDNIAKDTFGDWNAPEAILKAAQLAAKMREESLAKKESICFETVMSAPDKIDFIKRAKETGYFIRLFFVGTSSPMINASRIALRVMNGGHDVPIAKIVSR